MANHTGEYSEAATEQAIALSSTAESLRFWGRELMYTHYDADIRPPHNSSARGSGVEASSDNRCPCCDAHSWCFILDDGNAVLCGRTSAAPEGWEQTGTAKDGRDIYAKVGTRTSNRRYKGILPEPVNVRLEVSARTDFPKWVEIGSDHRGIRELQIEYLYPDAKTGEPVGKVVRQQWEDRRPVYEGKNKYIHPWHWQEPYHPDQGDQGWWSDRGKGLKPWPLYRESEVRDAIASGECQILFNGTGEQAVETIRQLGLFSITAQGGEGTGDSQVIDFLKRNTPQVFVIVPDEDETGHIAAGKLQDACNRVKIPAITVNLKNIWPCLPSKGDIKDVVEKSGMSESEIVKRLEAEIRRAIAARLEHDRKLNDPDERLKLDLQALLKESDPIKRMRRRAEIASHYRLKASDIEEALKHIEQQSTTPQKTWFTFDDFFNEGTEAIQWVVPSLLPRGETVLLAAQAKCGKTNLATDVMYAVLSGGAVLGEQVGVKGKVLLISSDESPNSTRRRMRLRGFDLLDERSNFRLMTHLDITNLTELEAKLEEFRPDLVVIDSLTTICSEVGISEKDPEFARYIYKLKAVLGRYNAACILTHHENKDSLAKGINQVSGSARIPAAVWGILQLKAVDPNNDADPRRWLKLKPREGEATILSLELNPKDTWLQDGIWTCHGEVGDATGEKKTQGARVLNLLRQYSPKGLTYKEIDAALNIGKSLYQVLDRLEDRHLITKRRSLTDKRQWVYALPGFDERSSPDEDGGSNSPPDGGNTPPPSTEGGTPPPSADQTEVFEKPESPDNTSFQEFNKQFNNNSTTIQQPLEETGVLNSSKPGTVSDSAVIQHPDAQGGGEGALSSTSQTLNSESGAIASNATPVDTTEPQQLEATAEAAEQSAIAPPKADSLRIGDFVCGPSGHVVEIVKPAIGGWLTSESGYISRSDLRAGTYVKVAPAPPVEELTPAQASAAMLSDFAGDIDDYTMLCHLMQGWTDKFKDEVWSLVAPDLRQKYQALKEQHEQ